MNAFHKVLMCLMHYFVCLQSWWVNINIFICLGTWQIALKINDVSFEDVTVIFTTSLDLKSLIHFLLQNFQNRKNYTSVVGIKQILFPLSPGNNKIANKAKQDSCKPLDFITCFEQCGGNFFTKSYWSIFLKYLIKFPKRHQPFILSLLPAGWVLTEDISVHCAK